MIFNIFTHFSGFNYGAFFQAFGSQYFIRSFLDNPYICYGPCMPFKNRIKEYRSRLASPSSLGPLIDFRITRLFRSYQYDFLPKATHLTLTDLSSINIYGADEILNVTSPFFSSEFFPPVDKLSRSFYLSASLGSAHYSDFSPCYSGVLNSILRENRLTVRDSHSANVISELTGLIPPITCDPAYYLPLKELAILHDPSISSLFREPYILIYGHHLPKSSLEQIYNIAQQEKLKIISYPYCNKISTNTISALSPFQLLSLFLRSRFVVTNMFHGVVLSSILNPSFAFVPNDLRSKKLSYIANSYSLTPKFWNDTFQSPYSHFYAEYDHKSLQSHIQYSTNVHKSVINSLLP